MLTVIPARYASTRLPGKPLAEISGRPMIQWVYEAVQRVRFNDSLSHAVLVATDDRRVFDQVVGFGGKAMMTPVDLQSGTDRVAYVAERETADIFVNVQGDEPLMDPVTIEKTVDLVRSGRFPMASAMSPFRNLGDFQSKSVVKVIADQDGRAVYFSRFPIPYSYGAIPSEPKLLASRRHIGIYAFNAETLRHYAALRPTDAERAESLEQLRALTHGIPIGLVEVESESIGVDTPEDLEIVKRKVLER